MLIFKRIFIPIASFLAVSFPVAGSDDKARLSTEEAVDVALAQNRDLTAARFTIRQAQGRLVQAGLWHNPEFELSRDSDRQFSDEGERAFSAEFSQRFPVSGRLARAKEVARVDVAMAFAEVRNQERLLAGEVQGRARELLVLRERLNTNEELQQTIKELVAVSENRLKAAEVSSADLNSAKLEFQKLTLARTGLLMEAETAATALNRLLGRDPDAELKVIGAIEKALDLTRVEQATREAAARRPDLQLSAAAIDRAGAEARLARAERWEDWTVGVGFSRERSTFDGEISNQSDDLLGIRISIPLPLWNRNQGRISEVRATQGRAQAELEALELQIRTEARTAENTMRRFLSIVNQYESEAIGLAEENIAVLQKGYGEGLVGITAVIQAQQQYVDLRRSYWEAVGEFLRALTAWQVATASYAFLNEIEPETHE